MYNKHKPSCDIFEHMIYTMYHLELITYDEYLCDDDDWSSPIHVEDLVVRWIDGV
jgi:hypothetical protein